MSTRLLALILGVFPVTVLADRFADWDKNKDGKLQKDELPNAARKNFERVDTNKDGVISREEDAAFMKRGRNRDQAESAVFRELKNLDYVGSGNPRQTLDLFLPKAKSGKARPLLVYIHGGGWRAGSKEGGLRRLLPYLETSGYAGASINYRLTNESRWPTQIHDCKAAIRWLKAHAGEYGYDAGKIAVWGTSAGGHLVAMLGVCGDVPELEGKLGKHLDQTSGVACVVNFFGPSNLLTMDDFPSTIKHSAADSPEGKLVGGALLDKKEIANSASPVTHVSKPDAPMLLAHGTKDKLVPHNQSVDLAKRLKAAGVPAVFITLEGAGHGFRSEELQRRVTAFLGRHLGGKETRISSETISKGK
ncbi:MAG: alpha/beta hydrolase [Roseibacillus sp.]